MARAFSSPQHNALRALLAKKREKSRLRRVDLAKAALIPRQFEVNQQLR